MTDDEYLKIYKDKVIYSHNGVDEAFMEGRQSESTRVYYQKIVSEFSGGYIERLIENSVLSDNEKAVLNINSDIIKHVKNIVDGVTSEHGRSLAALTFLMLSIKSIVPQQSIRLHKGSKSNASFSWQQGISMRTLDKSFITPVLRSYGLLKLNADGIMMTRSLAENYPYTSLYKANLKGPKYSWIRIIDIIEANPELALVAIKLFINKLKQRSEIFSKLKNDLHEEVCDFLTRGVSAHDLKILLFTFPEKSSYSARVFEILIHSFFNVNADKFDQFLKPLSQMRSANKKHGNIGDIELLHYKDGMSIYESWDAKFGKPYLRDELEELKDKLGSHPETEIAGFITNINPNMKNEIVESIESIQDTFSVSIKIMSIVDWYKYMLERFSINSKDEDVLLKNWLLEFTAYLCLEKVDIAPIDEPTDMWLSELITQLKNFK